MQFNNDMNNNIQFNYYMKFNNMNRNLKFKNRMNKNNNNHIKLIFRDTKGLSF